MSYKNIISSEAAARKSRKIRSFTYLEQHIGRYRHWSRDIGKVQMIIGATRVPLDYVVVTRRRSIDLVTAGCGGIVEVIVRGQKESHEETYRETFQGLKYQG